jgi:PIN like domain
VVAREGWLIVTRDSRIQDHQAEIDAVRLNGARMVVLAGKEAVHEDQIAVCATGVEVLAASIPGQRVQLAMGAAQSLTLGLDEAEPPPAT